MHAFGLVAPYPVCCLCILCVATFFGFGGANQRKTDVLNQVNFRFACPCEGDGNTLAKWSYCLEEKIDEESLARSRELNLVEF